MHPFWQYLLDALKRTNVCGHFGTDLETAKLQTGNIVSIYVKLMQFQKEPGGVSKVLSHRDALIDVITCDVLTKTTIFIWRANTLHFGIWAFRGQRRG